MTHRRSFSCIVAYGFLGALLLMAVLFLGCDQIKQLVTSGRVDAVHACTDGTRALNVGFYTYFEPVSFSADADPASDGFNAHRGYEADLLTALEAMEGTGLTFDRRGIANWEDIWLKSATPEYDIIGGGITILESRTQDATGTPVVAFTSGHIKFRQSLLVRAEDAQRLNTYDALTGDVRVGALASTTGEFRLLERTGLVDATGILVAGARVDTRQGSVIADGTANYIITPAEASLSLVGRHHLYPPSENMPQVVYLGDEIGESELLDALGAGAIDAIARGAVGNSDAAYISGGRFVVGVVDDQVEYGGFTFAVEDAELAACIDEKINYLTDGGRIGYGEWVKDASVFIHRAQMWSGLHEVMLLPHTMTDVGASESQ